MKYDVCIIGSGAGAGPVIYELSKAGYKVIVLEKGPWFRTSDFTKDELVATRRSVYTPNLKDEFHVIEEKDSKDKWQTKATNKSGWDFWNGNCVGGSSNFMSGYFSRLKPSDFKLLSTYGAIKGANIVDWPITYDDLEPYYTKVEQIVGVSGKVVRHKFQEPRSTKDFPYPPLKENIISSWIDKAADEIGVTSIPLARAILSKQKGERKSCYYSNYCGSYGCSSDAKGSSRVSLIHEALKTGNCTVIPNAKVYYLHSNENTVQKALYHDVNNVTQEITAKIFVVAAQAIETSRLLLNSKNKFFPNGLANNNSQVGNNLVFSSGGVGGGDIIFNDISDEKVAKLKELGVFVNRTIHDYYEVTDFNSNNKVKGGTIDFLFEHANPVSKAIRAKRDDFGDLLYGEPLQENLLKSFKTKRSLKFEIFVDWSPTDNCFVSLDEEQKDKWGDNVAKVRLFNHQHDREISKYIGDKALQVLEILGAKNTYINISDAPPTNLQAGGCRFGNNPKTSVLDKNCKAHEVDNLYVTDGSFMPTGGSITYTWTIYANSFRVADKIIERLKNN